MSALRPYRIHEAELQAAVAAALKSGGTDAIVPVTFHAPLVGGVLVSDARLRIRVEVTLAERAGGFMRRESESDIALREVRQAAVLAAEGAAAVIARDAAIQARLYALCVEADERMSAETDAPRERGFFRLRASLRALRDTLHDNGRAGRRIVLKDIPDLLSMDAWTAVVPAGLDLERMRREVMMAGAAGDAGLVDRIAGMAQALAADISGAPTAWRDLTPEDIAAITSDHRVAHLLTTAGSLRDQAATLAGIDPARAGRLMAEVAAIEAQALEAATGRNALAAGDDLEGAVRALRSQAGRSIGYQAIAEKE